MLILPSMRRKEGAETGLRLDENILVTKKQK